MEMINSPPCTTCGGTVAGELDRGAARLVCLNCGHDRWVALPRAPLAQTGLKEPTARAVGRYCHDCRTDISDRHGLAVRCIDCAIRRERVMELGYRREAAA